MRSSAALAIGILLLLSLSASAFALANYTNTSIVVNGRVYDVADLTYKPRYAVTITKSGPHNMTYFTAFNRPGNFSYAVKPKPKVLLGSQPQAMRPLDLKLDVPVNNTPVRLDPRTCPNSIAFCYQKLLHEQNRTLPTNHSPLSSYVLPPVRIRQYVCIGDDAECVNSSTNCFCTTQALPRNGDLPNHKGGCELRNNLCADVYGRYYACEGNLTSCQERHDYCGCGSTTACPAKYQTCINARDELQLCRGTLHECARQFSACFCGPDMLTFQRGCTSTSHKCTKPSGDIVTCYGTLENCAIKYDKCDC